MKRKIISVLFALLLVLSFSLMTAVPAMAVPATHNVIPFTLEAGGAATATWTTAEKHTGSSSVKLVIVEGSTDYAEVSFGVNIALEDIDLDTTSFWVKSASGDYIPYFIFEILGDFGTSGVRLRINNDAASSTGYSSWAQFVASNTTSEWKWQILLADWNVENSGWDTWDNLVTTYGTEIVTRVLVAQSGIAGAFTAYVDDVTVSGTTYDLEGTSADYFTIQAAINAASAGDNITVQAGIYDEQLTIDKQLRLTGVGDPIVQPLAAAPLDVEITDSGDGTIIQGFTFDFNGADSTRMGKGFRVLAPDVEIRDNTIELGVGLGGSEGGDVGIGIFVGPGFSGDPTDVSGLLIDSNSFVGAPIGEGGTPSDNGSVGIWLDKTATATSAAPIIISNSSFSGPLYAGVGVATSNVTILDNDLTGPGSTLGTYGIGLGVGGDGVLTNITVDGNTIESFGTAIDVLAGSGSVTATITYNTLSGNSEGVFASGAATLTVSNNNITGNVAGIVNEGSVPVDAENNWWGNASGPVWAGMDYDIAYGDTVSNNVDYQPWLLEEVEEGVTPTTYEKTLALKDGWTLVSVDKEVTTGTAWTATLAYKYTAGSGYAQVTLATQLTSVDGFYVKTDGGGGVGIKYSTAAPGVVTKTLGAGWNIISAAGETDAYTLLSQLRHVTIGTQQGAGITNLIGQGTYNQFTNSFSYTLTLDPSYGDWSDFSPWTVTLSPYDGYWVYMNAAKTFGVIP